MKTRGQAALEFLSTYGFAFLIILVMIGALSYFGVLNPTRFLPERCLVGTEFDCRDYQILRDGVTGDLQVSVVLVNNKGNTVHINTVGTPDIRSNFPITLVSCSDASNVANGATATIVCDVEGDFPAAGEKIKLEYDFIYQELGGTFSHPIKGEIFATIQE
jgi:hypothetical protein